MTRDDRGAGFANLISFLYCMNDATSFKMHNLSGEERNESTQLSIGQKWTLEDNLWENLSGRERTALYESWIPEAGNPALSQNPIFSARIPMQSSGLPMRGSGFVHHVQIG